MIVFIIVMLHYVIQAAPTTYLLDSSELVATTYGLGISHPPGHPSYTLLSHLFTYLPIGNFAMRVQLFGAFIAALTAALVPIFACKLGWCRSKLDPIFFAFMGVAIGISDAFVIQSIRAEVYTLHTFIGVLALLLMMTFQDPQKKTELRRIFLAAVVLGIGLLNHHYLTIFLMPALAFAMLVFRKKEPLSSTIHTLFIGVFFGIITLFGYSYLLASGFAQHTPPWLWPSNLEDVFWMVSAQAFQKTAENAAHMDPIAGILKALAILAEQFSIFGLLFAIIGFFLLFRRNFRQGMTLFLALIFNLLTQILFEFDPMNPDVLGYFMTSVWIIGIVLAFGMKEFSHLLSKNSATMRLTWSPVLILFGMILVSWLQREIPDRPRNLRDYWDSELFMDSALIDLAPESLWITSYFETAFNTWHAQGPEDRRPDVTHIHRSFRTYGYLDEILLKNHPEIADILDAPAQNASLNQSALLSWAAIHEVRMEADRLISDEEASQCIGTGLYLRFVAPTLPNGELPNYLMQYQNNRYQHTTQLLSDDLQTRRNLLWSSFNIAELFCRAQRWQQCKTMIDISLLLAPNDPDVQAFAESINEKLEEQ